MQLQIGVTQPYLGAKELRVIVPPVTLKPDAGLQVSTKHLTRA